MKKKINFLCCFLFFFCLPSMAQTGKDLKKNMQQTILDMQKGFDSFQDSLQKDFRQYVALQDAQFSKMLEESWSSFNIMAGEIRKEMPLPKPKQAPVVPVQINPITSVNTPQVNAPKKKPIHLDPLPDIPVLSLSVPIVIPSSKPYASIPNTLPMGGLLDEVADDFPLVVDDDLVSGKEKEEPSFPEADAPDDHAPFIDFMFYGNMLRIRYDEKCIEISQPKAEEKAVASYWRKMGKTNYNTIISELYGVRNKLSLNDWGFYLLTQAAANKLFAGSRDAAVYFTWFILNKAGYRVQIAFTDKGVQLLLPTVQKIYERPFMEKDGQRYYLTVNNVNSLRTYKGEFSEGNKALDLNLASTLNFKSESLSSRSVNFRYDGKPIKVTFTYNPNILAFYKDYPFTEMDVYFNAAVTNEVKESAIRELQPIIDHLERPEDKVQLLLAFFHQGIPYKTDEEQFGKERYLFVEESLEYPYSDCEDRAIFFNFLVETLLEYPTIGIIYPGHCSAGVHIPEYHSDRATNYSYNDLLFTSTDPTYINASVGMVMRDYAGVKIRPICTRTTNLQLSIPFDEVWSEMAARKIEPASSDGSICRVEDGVVLCAYKDIGTTDELLLGKINNKKKVVWELLPKTANGGIIRNPYIQKIGKYIYLKGVSDSPIDFEGHSLKTQSDPYIFVSKISQQGEVLWVKDLPILSKKGENGYKYVLTEDGEYIRGMAFPETNNLPNNSISLSPNNQQLELYGYFQFDPMDDVDRVIPVEKQLDLLLSEKRVEGKSPNASLYSMLHLLGKSFLQLDKISIVKFLNNEAPQFVNQYSTEVAKIDKIKPLKEFGRVFEVNLSSNADNIKIGEVIVGHDARFELRLLPGGDIRLETIKGLNLLSYGKILPLNYFILDGKTTSIHIDYGDNHAKKVIRL